MDKEVAEFIEQAQALFNEKVGNDFSLMRRCRYAGSLAALGYPEYLHKAMALLRQEHNIDRLEDLFAYEIDETLTAIRNERSLAQGFAVMRAQEIYVFLSYCVDPELVMVRQWLPRLKEKVENAKLDEAAREALADSLQACPLPDPLLFEISRSVI